MSQSVWRAFPIQENGWRIDMSYESDAAKRYRQYAQELRVIAEDATYQKSRQDLLALASECVQMAENFEAIERSHRAIRKRYVEGTPAPRRSE